MQARQEHVERVVAEAQQALEPRTAADRPVLLAPGHRPLRRAEGRRRPPVELDRAGRRARHRHRRLGDPGPGLRPGLREGRGGRQGGRRGALAGGDPGRVGGPRHAAGLRPRIPGMLGFEKVHIRAMRPDDEPHLFALAEECCAPGQLAAAETVGALSACDVFVAEHDGEVAGYVALVDERTDVVIRQLLVATGHTERKVGDQLCDWAEGYAVSRRLRPAARRRLGAGPDRAGRSTPGAATCPSRTAASSCGCRRSPTPSTERGRLRRRTDERVPAEAAAILVSRFHTRPARPHGPARARPERHL